MNNSQQDKKVIYHCRAGGPLKGRIRIPGDKSISHRSIMLGSLAEGTTHITGFLEGEDAIATLKAFRAMGVKIDGPDNGKVVIEGVGLWGLTKPEAPVDLGNSGTSMRLMSGLMAGQGFDVSLTGDKSLSSRPMERIIKPLTQMGAEIESTDGGTPPLNISGKRRLNGIDYQLPMASAQVKSCVLLAGLYANGKTCVTEPAPTRDHTERMLTGFAYPLERQDNKVCLQGGGKLIATNIDIPGDISSAAFIIVAAAITPESDVTLLHVGINPTRIGIITIMRLMGADIRLENERDVGGEPVADIRVRSSDLQGIEIPADQVPLAIDEFPVIFVAAACARGKTLLRGAEELRVKESDRIQVMADALSNVGVDAQPTPDGMVIQGGPIQGGNVDSRGDHRIAMAMAIAALRATTSVTIDDCENVNTSFPGFVRLVNELGHEIAIDS